MKKEVAEAELIKAIAIRDKEAYGTLYDQYAPVLFKIILLNVKDRAMTEDILEETFLTICSYLTEYHLQPARFLLWMAGIARQCALAAVKKSAAENQDQDPIIIPVFGGIALTGY